MVLRVTKYRIPLISEPRHNAGIRRKPRRKDERRFRTLELGESSFQLRVRFAAPTYERTSPATPTLALTRDSRRFNQPLIRRQSEVVIRTKVNQLATIENNARSLPPGANSKPPTQPRALQVTKYIINPTKLVTRHGRHHSNQLNTNRTRFSPAKVTKRSSPPPYLPFPHLV
jgi:hypothetical protein